MYEGTSQHRKQIPQSEQQEVLPCGVCFAKFVVETLFEIRVIDIHAM